MNRRIIAVFFALIAFLTAFPAAAGSDSLRIRTFLGMEPYGRMSVKNWGNPGQLETWNAAYGITPGIEVFGVLGEKVELGAGARFQIPGRIFRSGGSEDVRFHYIPVYAAGRFDIIDTVGIDMYGVVRLGYSFLLSNQAFRDVWTAESGGVALEKTGGGLYAGASLGVVFVLADRENWGLDWSMDAGYSFHGGSGTSLSGKGFAINYQAMSADFSLDWRF